jgi:hypothetical protein
VVVVAAAAAAAAAAMAAIILKFSFSSYCHLPFFCVICFILYCLFRLQ